MAQVGTPERRAVMARALRDRGYLAAAEQCANDPAWEDHYATLLGSFYSTLTTGEQRAIFPWNFNDDDDAS